MIDTGSTSPFAFYHGNASRQLGAEHAAEPVRATRCARALRFPRAFCRLGLQSGTTGGTGMIKRATGIAALFSLILARPAAAQRGGTVEVGGFARYVDFDRSLGMGTGVAAGGRVGLYLEPGVALELDLARASASSITYTPLHVRAVHNASLSARLEGLVGAGYVHNWYGAPYAASDDGLSVLLGLRYQVGSQVWVRLGADLDAMFHTADNTRFMFYNGNWGIHFGVSTRFLTGAGSAQ
jgi:hypothetical protein